MTDDRTWSTNSQNLTYRFNNGVPNQLTESIGPWVNNARAGWDAVFAQDTWTRSRLTLQGALRFDTSSSWFPAQQEGPSRFLPTPILIPETKGVNSYKDITPRLGVAYDVFGNGKTAIKANIGKYLEGVGVQLNYANANPTLRFPQTTSVFGTAGVTRTWTDANGNFTPDCNLQNPNSQDLRATGGDFCGALSNLSFGQNITTNNYDPALLNGWGVRSSDWNLGASIQQQLMARASIEVAYSRRWYHGFTVNDNLALSNSRRDALQHRRTRRSAAAQWRRLHGVRSLRRQPRQVRTDQQPRHRLEQLRQGVPVLQRCRHHVERAIERRSDLPGRHQHGPDRGGRLRCASEPARS